MILHFSSIKNILGFRAYSSLLSHLCAKHLETRRSEKKKKEKKTKVALKRDLLPSFTYKLTAPKARLAPLRLQEPRRRTSLGSQRRAAAYPSKAHRLTPADVVRF